MLTWEMGLLKRKEEKLDMRARFWHLLCGNSPQTTFWCIYLFKKKPPNVEYPVQRILRESIKPSDYATRLFFSYLKQQRCIIVAEKNNNNRLPMKQATCVKSLK
jgi:hypothetical protein